MMIRLAGWLLVVLLTASAATGAPERYRLDTARSVVGFSVAFQGRTIWGRMPIRDADLRLDLDRLSTSRIEVVLDARRARIGNFLMTKALHLPALLDTRTHPAIRFRATRIRGSPTAATVEGELTVKGVSRPVTLTAALYRRQGTAPTDRSRLVVVLRGAIDRRDFGAAGFAGMVGERIELRILVAIEK